MPATSMVSGFSAIECLITLAIIATVMLTGLPRLGSMIIAKRTEVASPRIFESLYEARGYAVNAATVVILCPGSPQSGCISEIDWSIGWFSFVAANRNSEFDSTEIVVSHQTPIKGLLFDGEYPFGFDLSRLVISGPTVILRSAMKTASIELPSWSTGPVALGSRQILPMVKKCAASNLTLTRDKSAISIAPPCVPR